MGSDIPSSPPDLRHNVFQPSLVEVSQHEFRSVEWINVQRGQSVEMAQKQKE